MKDPIKAMHMYICINLNWGLLGYRFLLSHDVFVEMYDCIVNYALNLKSMSIYEFIFRISQSYSQFDWLWWAGRRLQEILLPLLVAKGVCTTSKPETRPSDPIIWVCMCVQSCEVWGVFCYNNVCRSDCIYTYTRRSNHNCNRTFKNQANVCTWKYIHSYIYPATIMENNVLLNINCSITNRCSYSETWMSEFCIP